MSWMRNGWMRFMCPTCPTVGLSEVSPAMKRLPPCRPPSQWRPSRSRLSSNSCWTLTCLIATLSGGLPAFEQREEVGGARRVRELVAEGALGEHLRELGQELQVKIGGLLRHEEHEHLRHGLAVGRVERDRLAQPHERAARLRKALDAAVRNRDALAEARGPELLACGEARRDRARVEAPMR